MRLSFSTARLAVRDWRDLEADPSARSILERALPPILTEPVLRHLPPQLQHGGAGFDPIDWLRVLVERAHVGVVSKKPAVTPIGFLTLRLDPGGDAGTDAHLGYLFSERVWGRGLATELVKGAVDALRGAGVDRVFAGVATGNAASMHVLRKAGFAEDPEASTADLVRFRLDTC